MRLMFFSKYSDFYADSQNAIKNSQKRFAFFDNCVWIGCCKFSLLWQESLSSAVNVMTASVKILDLIKKDVFQLNFAQNDEKIE